MKVPVINGNLEAAIRKVKNNIMQDGTYQKIKSKQFYLKPSAQRREYKKKLEANWRKKMAKAAKYNR